MKTKTSDVKAKQAKISDAKIKADTSERDPSSTLPEPGPSYARVPRQPSGIYTELYFGRQRAPRYQDEAGATCVIDLIFAEPSCSRFVLYAIPGDREYLRVESLPEHEPAHDLTHINGARQ